MNNTEKRIWEFNKEELLGLIYRNLGLTIIGLDKKEFDFWKSFLNNKLPELRIENPVRYPFKITIKVIKDQDRKVPCVYPMYIYGSKNYYNSAKVSETDDITCDIAQFTKELKYIERTVLTSKLGDIYLEDKSILEEETIKNKVEKYKEDLLKSN